MTVLCKKCSRSISARNKYCNLCAYEINAERARIRARRAHYERYEPQHNPARSFRLTDLELKAALDLWESEGLGTAGISKRLGICEPAVANSLADWRNEEYLKRSAA